MRIHEVPEELPSGGHLEALEPLLASHVVQRLRRRHGARSASKASGKVGNDARVGGDDGDRVGRAHEESRAQDHGAVRIAISSATKAGQRRRVHTLRRAAVAKQAHALHQRLGVGQVGVRMQPAKVRLRHAVVHGSRGGAQLLAEDAVCVWPSHAVERIVDHVEVRTLDHRTNGGEVEHAAKKRQVVLRRVDHFHREGLAVGPSEVKAAQSAQVHGGKVLRRQHTGDALALLVDGVRHALRGRAAVGSVILDAEVALRAARVVGRGQDDASIRDTALALTDHGRHGRGAQQTVLANPDATDAIRGSNLEDDLNCLR
mmetsp:Transcript_3855/g.12235  ORF Transcript_3855/g.12235 Transcript_3855/m.12235 type:complete len:316 (-) Transcript_3855:215-1162(-)